MIKRQNAKVGFGLALLTAVVWAGGPSAMKFALEDMDPYTLVWYRFLISACTLFVILAIRKQLPPIKPFKRIRRCVYLAIATLGLMANFMFFVKGVVYLPATTAQVVGQVAIIFFVISNALVFKEKLMPSHLIGMITLFVGLGFFFNSSLRIIFSDLTGYALGVWYGFIAALLWACYALAQKALLKKLKAAQLLCLIYIFCVILLSPFVHPMTILNLSTGQIIAVLFCGFNTVIGYGALVAAMEYWDAPKVSAVTTLTPLFTLVLSDLLALIWPDLFSFMTLNVLGFIGAIMVVMGAMITTVGHYVWHHRSGFLINRKKGENR